MSKRVQLDWRGAMVRLILLACVAAYIIPFLWMISTSLKFPAQTTRFPPIWIPRPVAWTNYPDAIAFIPFFTYLRNTVVYCALSVIGVTISSCLVGYSFAKLDWPGRDVFFVITLSTMMLPSHVTLIPLYLMFRAFGWMNSYRPLVIPAFFGNAFFIFLLRQFFMSIPEELSDAARIDGASEFGILWQIILPLSRPAIAVVVLFQFLNAWKDFLGPLIYLNDDAKYPLSLGLQQYLSMHGQPEWGLLMAASTLTILPVLALFVLCQKTFIEGITLTGLKS